MEAREELKDMVDALARQRDELALKAHLARAEARDEWNALEKKLEHLRARAEVVGDEAASTARDVGAAARRLVEELKEGYARIRRLI